MKAGAEPGIYSDVTRQISRSVFPARGATLIGVLILVLVMAACTTTVSRPVFKELSFERLPRIEFNVARIELVEAFQSPLREPNIEYTFPTPPALAFKRWVHDRLRAEGGSGAVRVTIRDASVLRIPLAANTDIEGLITTEQGERLDATLNVLIEIMDAHGVASGSYASAESQRSRTVPEDLTLNERDLIYQEITEALINDINATLEQNIRQYLRKHLR